MADKKISQLTSATTPLAGTEVLPIIQSNSTVKVANNDLRPKQIQSNATSGVMQIVGPGVGATRVMTIPNADFTVARTDTAQSFTGAQAIGLLTSNNSDTQNKTQQIQYENTNGAYCLATGYSTAFYSYANNGTTGNIAYLSNGGNYLEIAAGLVGIVGSTFTIGVNTYTITNSTPQGYIYVTPSAIAEAATGTLTGLKYAIERVRVNPSGDFTLKSGNFIIGTAGKGIDFSANSNAAGMTSELLNWYEEGTWTPNQGAGLALVGSFSSSGTYTRIGRTVIVRGQVVGVTSVAVNAAGVISSNLPFTAASTHAGSMFNDAVDVSGVVQILSASVVAATTIAATPNITFTATYSV